jgi:hypothetical protein
LEKDRRVAAIEAMARGSLEAIHERRSGALAAFGRALEIWSQLGYRYREAVTALLMHEVDGDAKHLAVAARALACAPRSWLSQEVEQRKSTSSSRLSKLTPAERRVMLAICEGKTSREWPATTILAGRVASRRTVTRPVVVVLGAMMRHGPWSWTLPTERRPREGHRAAMATKLRTLRVDRVPWENAWIMAWTVVLSS